MEEKKIPVTERIKTFDDACKALGDEHPFVTQYKLIAGAYKGDPMTEDLIAYLKLRIIAAALNEGWEPHYEEKKEYRFYPLFFMYTQQDYNSYFYEDDKRGCMLLVDRYTSASDDIVGCHVSWDTSSHCAELGSRLVFKNPELAEYAGRQFIEEWADFML